jgi:hypothetical protein
MQGDLIVVGVNWYSQAATASVTDTLGSSYQTAVGPTDWAGTTYRAQVFYAKNVTAGATTVTVTLSGADTGCEIYVQEYAGVDPSSPLDQTSAAIGVAGDIPDSGSRTTTQANELVFGYAQSAGTIAAQGAGFAARSTYHDNLVEDTIAPQVGNYSASFTSSDQDWVAMMATFKGVTPPSSGSASK